MNNTDNATHLNFKCEILFQVLDDHHQKWKFDAQCLLLVCWTCDKCGAEIISITSQYNTKHKNQ